MKKLSAFLAALFITGLIGLGIFLIGASALSNKNTVATKNSPGIIDPPGATTTSSAAGDPSQVQQLQSQISQYQTALQQADNQLQQYQSLLQALQQQGLILIGRDGNIYINSGGGDR